MLTLKEVQRIAALARLEVSDGELIKFQEELASILEYFEILSEVDVTNTEPLTHVLPLKNVGRTDEAKPKGAQEAQRLLDMAPSAEHGYFKVKSILEWNH